MTGSLLRARAFVAIFLGFFAAPMVGCASGPAKPFLWKIEKGGHESWLLGTLSIGVPAEELSANARARLASSGGFVTEFDWRPTSKATIEMSPSLPGLDVMLTAEAWGRLQTRLSEVPADKLKRLNPNFVIFLMEDLERRKKAAAARPVDPAAAPSAAPKAVAGKPAAARPEEKPAEKPVPPSMDEALLAEARARGLAISYLEELTPSVRACFERSAARDLEDRLAPRPRNANALKNEDDMARVVGAYRSGDLGKIAVLQAEEERDVGIEGECSVESRNRSWAQKIARLHEVYSPAFIAIGVGHMATKTDTLLERLKAEGFAVERAKQ